MTPQLKISYGGYLLFHVRSVVFLYPMQKEPEISEVRPRMGLLLEFSQEP